MKTQELQSRISNLYQGEDFTTLALDIFRYQYEHVAVYRQFCQALGRTKAQVKSLEDIPFLPIQFFKSHQILAEGYSAKTTFTSSGTTDSQVSQHHVADLSLYETVFYHGFQQFYPAVEDLVVLALLPSYLEREGSSLIYMADAFIKRSKHPESGFYLNDYDNLAQHLTRLDAEGKPVLLLGVSFALLDLVERYQFDLNHTIIMETGGMKGRRKEMTRAELHHTLSKGFGVSKIHSEYGMTELLSQAYSKGDGIFRASASMDILIREPEDALSFLPNEKSGGINIIDLANLHSCSFIATQDLGVKHSNGTFEVLGRFDHSDIRGCNLMVL